MLASGSSSDNARIQSGARLKKTEPTWTNCACFRRARATVCGIGIRQRESEDTETTFFLMEGTNQTHASVKSATGAGTGADEA
jgi:hypothetical protein